MEKEKRVTTSLRLPPEDTKKLKHHCIEIEETVQDFLDFSWRYCMENGIKPGITSKKKLTDKKTIKK